MFLLLHVLYLLYLIVSQPVKKLLFFHFLINQYRVNNEILYNLKYKNTLDLFFDIFLYKKLCHADDLLLNLI